MFYHAGGSLFVTNYVTNILLYMRRAIEGEVILFINYDDLTNKLFCFLDKVSASSLNSTKNLQYRYMRLLQSSTQYYTILSMFWSIALLY